MKSAGRFGIWLLAGVSCLVGLGSIRAAGERPNIVFIMADDLGNADLGYRGSEIKTPHIDRLAVSGVRCESFYGMPVCSPSRACLMTGRYPMRYGLQTLVIFPSHTYGLPSDERTLPQALREAGYRTMMVGKWHLGHADKKYWPQGRGFDHFYGNLVGEVDYFTKERGGLIDWQRNGQFLREEGYFTTQLGDEAEKLIRGLDSQQPFFLYFASLAAHAPYQAPQEYLDRFASITDERRRTYAAMIAALDDQVDRIVKALDEKGLRDNTLIVFSSDNGGATSARSTSGVRSEQEGAKQGAVAPGEKPPASNGRLRGGKGTLYEGGVRVPTVFNWPGKLTPRVVDEPLHMVDVMPTLLALAGGRPAEDHPLDGSDIWPVLSAGEDSPHEELLINVEALRGAIRRGNWKLVKLATLPGQTELFDLAADPGEQTNIANQHPDVVRDLEARLLAYARQQRPSEWIRAQPSFIGSQGRTVFDSDFDLEDSGLPHERPVLPMNGTGR